MGIKLDVSVETPLSDDDRDILAGISVMVLAIANRQNLAEQAQQALDLEDATEGMSHPSVPIFVMTATTACARPATRVATSSGPSRG